MTGDPGADDGRASEPEEPPEYLKDPVARAWFGEHLPQLQRTASGNRLLYGTLALAFVLGLAAHIGGYALKASDPAEPFALIAELLYALGFALWTGVVVTLFVRARPEDPLGRRFAGTRVRCPEASQNAGVNPAARTFQRASFPLEPRTQRAQDQRPTRRGPSHPGPPWSHL
jgi:hypothetical protein